MCVLVGESFGRDQCCNIRLLPFRGIFCDCDNILGIEKVVLCFSGVIGPSFVLRCVFSAMLTYFLFGFSFAQNKKRPRQQSK